MKQLVYLSMFVYMMPAWHAGAQTNPYPHPLRGSDLVYSTFPPGVQYPVSMQGWSGPEQVTQSEASTTAQATGNEPLAPGYSSNSSSYIWNEEDNGIAISRYGSNNPGSPFAIALAINTTGCTGIKIGWTGKVRGELVGMQAFLQLQYRTGTSGNWINIDGHQVVGGVLTDQVHDLTQLPAEADNKPVIQFRWLYYATTPYGGDSFGIDEIKVTATTKSSVPVSDFKYEQDTISPLKVVFTDDSKNAPDTWNWDFGDGAVSILQNPEHIYADTGLYAVKLKVTNSSGADSMIRIVHVKPNTAAPRSGFIYTLSGLNVFFKDTSANYPTSWNWDFGDGITSTDQNPWHAYASAGTYNVCLKASNATGEDSICKDVMITVAGIESSEFVWNISPNPASDVLFVHLPVQPGYRLSLINMLGQEYIPEIKAAGEYLEADITSIEPGMYVVKVQSDQAVLSRPVLIGRFY